MVAAWLAAPPREVTSGLASRSSKANTAMRGGGGLVGSPAVGAAQASVSARASRAPTAGNGCLLVTCLIAHSFNYMSLSSGGAASGHEVLRPAAHVGFDVVDQLIGKELHGAVARPGDVRRQDEVRQAQLQQRIAFLGRLSGQDVETRAGDHSLLERLRQRLLIHQPAARGVDQYGRALH